MQPQVANGIPQMNYFAVSQIVTMMSMVYLRLNLAMFIVLEVVQVILQSIGH